MLCRLGVMCMRLGMVRRTVAKVGPLALKDPAPAEELRPVRKRTRRRLLLAVGALIGMASVAGQPPVTEPASAGGPPGNETIVIPVRWCALELTPTVINPTSLGATSTNGVLLARLQRATNDVWLPGANIILRSALTPAVNVSNFPVIADPAPPFPDVTENPPGNGPGGFGDILLPAFPNSPVEWNAVRTECEEEWDHLEVASGTPLPGVIAFSFNQFVDANGIPTTVKGLGEPPTMFTGATFPCVNPPQPFTWTLGAFTGLADFKFVGTASRDAKAVAHEFGHVLFLGHGNGLDDDGDMVYDGFCDPTEAGLDLPATIMHPTLSATTPTTVVTPLQRATSRAIARGTPGNQLDPPFELVNGDTVSDQRADAAGDVKSASLDMTEVSMVINTKQERVILSHTLFGLASKQEINVADETEDENEGGEPSEYVAFLDLDADQATGGRPAKLGFRTRFKGAELVTRVVVGEGRTATTTAWRLDGDKGAFADVTDSGVTATVSSPVGEEIPFPGFDVVSAQLPADVVGPVGSRVRLQAITASEGKVVDVLPGGDDVVPGERASRRVRAEGSADLVMVPPKYPACTTIPERVQPGDAVTIKAAGFERPGEVVDVIVGDKHIAKAKLDTAGNMSTDVAVPEETRGGPHLISIEVENTALTADCVLQVAT